MAYRKYGPISEAWKALLPENRPVLPTPMKVGARHLTIRDQDLSRFLSKVAVQPGGEWIWTGKTNRYGYGTFSVGGGDGSFVGAHRFAYTALVGPIPEGLDIDHVRHNDAFARGECAGGPTCPHRLEVDSLGLAPNSRSVNILGGAGAQAQSLRTGKCKWGHNLSGDNLAISIRKGRPVRCCRACNRAAYHRAVARKNNA